MKTKKARSLSSDAFDRAFDAGEDITRHLDFAQARRPGLASQRLSVDAPAWMVDRLDREAARLGITRQSLIKVWPAWADAILQGRRKQKRRRSAA